MPILLYTQTILIIVSFVLLFLYIREHFKNREIKNAAKTTIDNQEKSYQLLHQAIKKAENIVGIAELQGIKIAADSRFHTNTLENEYSQHIKTTYQEAQENITQARQEFEVYLQSLSGQADKSVLQSSDLVQERINRFFEKFENNLSSFLTETQSQSAKAIDLEMQAARQLIQSYKQQQFNLIDENIVAMLEQTINIVLSKKLSLKDHLEFVYESLEKAKADKFILWQTKFYLYFYNPLIQFNKPDTGLTFSGSI